MGKPQTPEHRAKIAAAMKAYHTTCKGEKGPAPAKSTSLCSQWGRLGQKQKK